MPSIDFLSRQDERLIRPAVAVATRLRELGARALLVGGLVRDGLMGLTSKDVDIEVYGLEAASLGDALEQMFPGQVDTVGRSFGVLKVFLGSGLDLDVSIPRRESKTGSGHKGFAVTGDPTMSVEEAARRRDFTINTLAADPLTGEIIDPYGGIEDLRQRVLRVTSEEQFREDPLRVYRAVQFAARFDLTIEPRSRRLLKEMVARGDLEELPAERITEELRKLLLRSTRPSVGLELMRELGIIERYFPELYALIGVEQEPEWHPEGDVWIHTMMVLDAAAKISRRSKPQEGGAMFDGEERLQLLLGALCHDLGKPATTTRQLKDGVVRIRSLGHEEAGVGPTGELLSRLCFGEAALQASVAVARDHLKPAAFHLQWRRGELGDVQYANALRKWLKRAQPTSWRVLLAASEADHRGRTIPGVETEPYDAGEHAQTVIEAQGIDTAATKPLLYGRDLIALGVRPGPQIGVLLGRIESARDEGLVRTREEALALARELLAARPAP